MNTTPLLSYLLFEGGEITVDEVSPSNRFGDMFSLQQWAFDVDFWLASLRF